MKAKTYTETVTRCVECPTYDSDCTCALFDGIGYIEDAWVIHPKCKLEDVL
jgi:hypothetical protein